MKKIIKSCFSIIITFCLMASILVFNVSAASVSVGGAGEYEVGKPVSVSIRFSADATLYAVEVDVNYNSSVLKLNSVSGAEYSTGNGTIKIVDDNFNASKPSKSSSYTLNFTAIAAGNSNVSVSVLGGGEAESKASGSAEIRVVTPKPSSNANLASIKLSTGSLSPAFNPNTTNYNATVKYDVEKITITGAVADGKSTYTGGGTFNLEVGENKYPLTVTAQDGTTRKTYTVNIKRMTEAETLAAEEEARNANPLLVIIDGVDYTIVNEIDDVNVPTGFTKATVTRKENEITVLNDVNGKYQLCYLVDANGENGAWYNRDENDNYTKLVYIKAGNVMYIIEKIEIDGALPSAYKNTKYVIDGIEADAITYADEALADFYIFNCYVPGSQQTAYYKYDKIEGTMQRAIDFNVALQTADTSEPTNTEPQQSTGKFSWFNNMNKTGKMVFFLMIFIGVVIIVAAILIISKIVSSSKEIDQDFNSNVNNEFVLGDFSNDNDTDNNN